MVYSAGTSYSTPPSSYVSSDDFGASYVTLVKQPEPIVVEQPKSDFKTAGISNDAPVFTAEVGRRLIYEQYGATPKSVYVKPEINQFDINKAVGETKFKAPSRIPSDKETVVVEPQLVKQLLPTEDEARFSGSDLVVVEQPKSVGEALQNFINVGTSEAQIKGYGSSLQSNPVVLIGASAVGTIGAYAVNPVSIVTGPVEFVSSVVTKPKETASVIVEQLTTKPAQFIGEQVGTLLVFEGLGKGFELARSKNGAVSKSEAELVSKFYEPTRKIGTVDVFTEQGKFKVTEVVNREVELKGFPAEKPNLKVKTALERGEISFDLIGEDNFKVKNSNYVTVDIVDVSSVKKGGKPAYVELTSEPKFKEIEIFSYGKDVKEYVNINKLGETEIITQRVVGGELITGKTRIGVGGKGVGQLFDVEGKALTKEFVFESSGGSIPLRYERESSFLKTTEKASDVKILETSEKMVVTGGSKVESIKPYKKGVSSITLGQETTVRTGLELDRPFSVVTKGKRVMDIRQSLPFVEDTRALTVFDKTVRTGVDDIKMGVKVEDVSAIKNRILFAKESKFPKDIINIEGGFKSVENPSVIRTNVVKVDIGGTIELDRPYSKRVGSVQKRTALDYVFRDESLVSKDYVSLSYEKKGVVGVDSLKLGSVEVVGEKPTVVVGEGVVKGDVQDIYVKQKDVKVSVDLPKNIQATITNPDVVVKGDSLNKHFSVFKDESKNEVLVKNNVFIKTRYDVRQDVKSDVIQEAKKSQEFIQKPSSKNEQLLFVKSYVRQDVKSDVIQEVKQSQDIVQELINEPIGEVKTKPGININFGFDFKMPKSEVPKPKFVSPKFEEKQGVGLFEVLVKRRGRFESRGRVSDLGLASQRLKYGLKKSISASGKIVDVKSGLVVTPVERSNEFYTKKGLLIQRRSFRLGSREEVSDIMSAKRLSPNKKKEGVRFI
jgi:hypothetical protein